MALLSNKPILHGAQEFAVLKIERSQSQFSQRSPVIAVINGKSLLAL